MEIRDICNLCGEIIKVSDLQRSPCKACICLRRQKLACFVSAVLKLSIFVKKGHNRKIYFSSHRPTITLSWDVLKLL